MANEPVKPPEAAPITVLGVGDGHPPWNIPILFVDGISTIAPAAGTIRFYVYRSDPENTGKFPYKNQIFAQVIMPTANFASTAAFFERALKNFVKAGTIPKDVVDTARKTEGLEPWPDPT